MRFIQRVWLQMPDQIFVQRLVILSALALSVGCNKATAPVQVDIAKETLTTVMESWKEGQSPEDLAPKITVQEMEWTGGAKLLDYEIMDDEKSMNSNLYAKVQLKLSQPNGQETTKTATYVISTSPGLSVFRDMMK